MSRLLPLLLLLLAGPLFAKTPVTFQPATFGDKKQEIISKIKFPEIYPGTPVNVLCEALISSRGRVNIGFCYIARPRANTEPYIFKVVQGFHRVYISPARINGGLHSAYMQFRVRFEKEDGRERIELFPNLGVNRYVYGDDYVAAQFYWLREGTGNCSNYVNLLMDMQVMKDGSLKDVRLLNKDLSKQCENYYVRLFNQRKYIPAFYQGKPVESHHMDFMMIDMHKKGINLFGLPFTINLGDSPPKNLQTGEGNAK